MPDIFLSQTQLLAIEFLERCVRDLEPLAALTGGAGTGKTVALNTMLARPESTSNRIIRVNNFVAGPMSLHRVLASALGVVDAGDLTAEALEPALQRALVDAGRSGPPVLAVDDAQSLLPETLRYLCLLAGLREAGHPLLRILLVGRPGFTIRQSMPRQFVLQAVAPDDASRLVLHGFEAAGVIAPDEAVQDIVRNGQGNLRKLDLLLETGVEQARVEGRRRKPNVRRQVTASGATGTPPTRRPLADRSSTGRSLAGPWLVVPALLVVGAAALAIAYHDGMFGGRGEKPFVTAATTTVPVPVPLPVPVPGGTLPLPAQAGITASPAHTPIVVPPTVGPTPEAPPSGAPARLASRAPPSPPLADAPAPIPVPAPVSTPSPSATEPPPVSPPAVPPAASPALASPPVANSPGSRFRVYNIGACHQGVCPRWSVTDLDQRQRFVAAFNPASLHLDRDTLQRLREGSLDLLVSGSVAREGSYGRTLNVDTLQEVVPHHGRARSQSSPPTSPVELAPPQLQSPPPGFLPVPPPGQ